MAEGTEYADGYNMEDWDWEEVMVKTDVRGYLYEPQYSDGLIHKTIINVIKPSINS